MVIFMRNFFIPLAAFLLPVSVLAADLDRSYQADIGSETRPGSFSGLYAGADVGVGIGTAGGANTSGYIGGAHLGYDLQFSRLMAGVEIDTLSTSISAGSFNSSEFSQKFLSSLRGRAGYIFGNVVVYGTGGFAYSTSAYRDVSGISRATIKGTAFGLGAEWSPIYKISLRAEALRYDFGSKNYATPLDTKTLSSATNLLRAGVHYRF